MNPVLEEIVTTGLTKTPDGKKVEVKPESISLKEGEYLQEIISDLNPSITLEIGMAYGVSSLYICDALKRKDNTRHIIIDPQDSKMPWFKIGLSNLERAGYGDIIEYHDMKSYEALPQLLSRGQKIDFAFIDGWHTFDYAFVDFFYIDKMLNVGGVVVFDDADWPSIRKLCRYIATNYSYSVLDAMYPISNDKKSIKRAFVQRLLKMPRTAEKMWYYFSPEALETDFDFGLNGSCIAFKKISGDIRRWDFHKPF
jgi:predicted O-methyltransferase YrrM